MGEFVVLFVVLAGLALVGLETGYRLSRRHGAIARPDRGALSVDGFVLTLLGLLLAFNLNSARLVFDEARALSIREANALRSARFLIASLEGDHRSEVLRDFRTYTSARLQYSEIEDRGGDLDAAYLAGLEPLGAVRHEAIALPGRPGAGISATLIQSALADVQNAASERHVLQMAATPALPAVLLLSMMVLASVLVGRDLAGDRRDQWWPRMTFTLPVAFVLAMIFDYDSPSFGVIRLDAADQMLRRELSGSQTPIQTR